jgi:hypothetical protein
MSLVTFDLDSTLADTRHRHHLINPDGVSTDWKAYSMACMGDAPITPLFDMALALQAAGHSLWIVSGRDAAASILTRRWLRTYGLEPDGMVLNDHSGGYVNHVEYKIAAIREAVKYSRAEHLFHVDDWPPVATGLAAVGLKCITVTPPRVIADFEDDGHLTFV